MQTRAPRVGHPLDVIEAASRLLQRPFQDGQNVPLMGTRRKFRHHPSIFGVDVLRCRELGEKHIAPNDRDARVITGTLDAEHQTGRNLQR